MQLSSLLARRALLRHVPSAILLPQARARSLTASKLIPHSKSLFAHRLQPSAVRFASSLSVPKSDVLSAAERPPQPSYQLTFTCKPCGERSNHTITKQGYHHGTVLVTCPGCKNRHVISDHLKIFMDQKSTLEDILQRTAGTGNDLTKLLKKGKLGIRQGAVVGNEGEEDVEFWEDGSETVHKTETK